MAKQFLQHYFSRREKKKGEKTTLLLVLFTSDLNEKTCFKGKIKKGVSRHRANPDCKEFNLIGYPFSCSNVVIINPRKTEA